MEIFFKNLTPEEGTAEKLLKDLRTLREDTEELFLATGGKLAERSKQKFLTAVERVKETCHDIKEKAATGAETADHTVHQFPYSTVGIAFGLGLIIGIIVQRR